MNKDILHVVVSDPHTGSINSLFLPHAWQGHRTGVVSATSEQVYIRGIFEKGAEEIKKRRKGIKVKVIVLGDAVEGKHHESYDVWTHDTSEMAEVSIELLDEFRQRIDWQRGDEIFFVRGTECHVGDKEHDIAKHFGVELHSEATIKTNDKSFLCVHHGAGVGRGANESNGLYNFLKQTYFDYLQNGQPIPDAIYSGHVHKINYVPFSWRAGYKFSIIHGVVCPSLQQKTIYAHMKSPTQRNTIGLMSQLITSESVITIPVFHVGSK